MREQSRVRGARTRSLAARHPLQADTRSAARCDGPAGRRKVGRYSPRRFTPAARIERFESARVRAVKAVSPIRGPQARSGTPSRAPNRRTPGSTALASGSSGSAGLVDAAWARGHRATSSEDAGGRKAPTVIDDPMSRTRASTPTERVPSPPHPASVVVPDRGSGTHGGSLPRAQHADTALGAASLAFGQAAESPTALRVRVRCTWFACHTGAHPHRERRTGTGSPREACP